MMNKSRARKALNLINSSFYVLTVLSLLVQAQHENRNYLGETVIGTLNSLENNLLKIVSCGNIDIEIAVKGTIMVSAGHFYMKTIERYQPQVQQEIRNETKRFTLSFPFIANHYQIRFCLFFVSLTGKEASNDQPNEYSLTSYPNSINQISSITLGQNTPQYVQYISPMLESLSNVYEIKGIVGEAPFRIQVFNKIKKQQGTNHTNVDLPRVAQISTPQQLHVYNSKRPDQTKKTIHNNNTSDHFYLNQNLVREIEQVQEGKINLLIERDLHSEGTYFSILRQGVSQFDKLQDVTGTDSQSGSSFSGINLVLNKCQKHIILLNNHGNLLMDIFSLKIEKLKVYRNLSSELSNSKACLSETPLSLPTFEVNGLQHQLQLLNSQPEDIYIIESLEDDVKVLLEIKPAAVPEVKLEKHAIEMNQQIEGEHVKLFPGNNITLSSAYLFAAENKQDLEENILIGESANKIFYFAEINPHNISLYDLWNHNKEAAEKPAQLFLAVRAYDQQNRVYLTSPASLVVPNASWTLTAILSGVFLLFGIAIGITMLVNNHLKNRKQTTQQDEVELIQNGVHIRMPSDS